MKKNCWEVKNCKDKENCPAFNEKKLNNIHGGYNGGRTCWIIAGTMCGGEVQGRFAQKTATCLACEFYNKVFKEESKDKGFKGSTELLKIIK